MFFPGQFGENIFDFFNSNVDAGDYSLAVNVEGDFKVVLTGDAWMIPNPIQGYGWDVMPYNTSNSSQTFTTNSNDADILIQLIGGGSSPKEIMVEYFVGCATTPSESFSIFVD